MVVEETCSIGNMNIEQKYCVLMYLYRSSVAVWQRVSQISKTTRVWNTTKIDVYIQYSKCLDCYFLAHIRERSAIG